MYFYTIMLSLMNLGYPKNLQLFLEQETAAFYQQQISGYPRNNSPKVISALIAA